MNRKLRYKGRDREKAFWGALIGGAISAIGSLFSSSRNAKAAKKAANTQIDAQNEAINKQNIMSNAIRESENANQILQNNRALANSYNNDYSYMLKNGGRIKTNKIEAEGNEILIANNFKLPGKGQAVAIGDDGRGHNMFLLRGRSHASGGIPIDVKGNGQVLSKSLVLPSGSTPVEEVMRGTDPQLAFARQEMTKRALGFNDDGTRKQNRRLKCGGRTRALNGWTDSEWANAGIGTFANLFGGLLTNHYLNKINTKAVLPKYAGDVVAAVGPTRYDIGAELGEVNRGERNAVNEILRNTANSNAALNRMQTVHSNAADLRNKSYQTKYNEETKLADANANREQQARMANLQNRQAWLNSVADAQNKMAELNANIAMQRGTNIGNMVSGIAKAWQDSFAAADARITHAQDMEMLSKAYDRSTVNTVTGAPVTTTTPVTTTSTRITGSTAPTIYGNINLGTIDLLRALRGRFRNPYLIG